MFATVPNKSRNSVGAHSHPTPRYGSGVHSHYIKKRNEYWNNSLRVIAEHFYTLPLWTIGDLMGAE